MRPSRHTTGSGEHDGQCRMRTLGKRQPKGKDMQTSHGGAVDPKKPLLTYSRPKGEYKGADADARYDRFLAVECES